MIKTDIGYRNTIELIKRHKEANKKLRKELPTLSGRKLKLLEKNSLIAIKELESEVREYERTRLKKAS
jgi:hypothetical protein